MKKSKTSKSLSLILAFMLLLGVLPFVAQAAEEDPEIWDGTIAKAYEGGSGTEDDPYLISNGAQLAFLAQETNAGNNYEGVYFNLTADICLNETADWEKWGRDDEGNPIEPQNKWVPIGHFGDEYQELFFTGNFDGKGHKISGMYVSGTGCDGLFGINEGVISDLSIEESLIDGYTNVGIVAGLNMGKVINCHNSGNVGRFSAIGGVVGENRGGTVAFCSNTGIVGGFANVGGVVGSNNNEEDHKGSVSECYNAGLINVNHQSGGGVVGSNIGVVKDCYNMGTVKGLDEDFSVGGGIAGRNGPDGGSVENCYNIGKVSGAGNIGGALGEIGNGEIKFCYYLDGCCPGGNALGTPLPDGDMKVEEAPSNAANFEGFDFTEVWTAKGNPDYPYPELNGNPHKYEAISLLGDVNGDTIIDATDMQRIYAHLNGSNPFDEEGKVRADVNKDGIIDATDMQRIYAHLNGSNPFED